MGTKFSDAAGLNFSDVKGIRKPVVMGSYGIGAGRLMATIAEVHNDARGLLWPEEVAPFRIHLIEVRSQKKELREFGESIYQKLLAKGIETLYDDRDEKTAGEKFADADLIGIPWRVVVSEKTLVKRNRT